MNRLFVNIDTNDYGTKFLNILIRENEKINSEDLYPFIDQYIESGITDLLICLNCQYSIPESRFFSDSVFKYEQKIENGIPVDYTKRFSGFYTVYKTYGLDPIKVWLDRCRDIGLNPWVSFRMNDCHFPDAETCFWRPELFYEARARGWMIGGEYGYFKNCLNYAIPEIRNIWLSYIDEQLYKYDMYGVELDFLREIYCFDYLNEPNCCDIMTDFIRNVRNLVKKHEDIKGHRIRLSVRLMRDLNQCRAFGFDVLTWDKEGLVDLIVLSALWETSDSDMPISEWKSVLKNTQICAGLETLLAPFVSPPLSASPEVVRGYANRYLSDGSCGLYLFNYYCVPNDFSEKEILRTKRSMKIFSTCKDLKSIEENSIRYIVTRQDIAPKGFQKYDPFPINLDKEGKTITLKVGNLSPKRKVTVFVGYREASPKDVTLTVFGKRVDNMERAVPKPHDPYGAPQNCECGYVPSDTVTYKAPLEVRTDGIYTLEFIGEHGSVTYIEFDIE